MKSFRLSICFIFYIYVYAAVYSTESNLIANLAKYTNESELPAKIFMHNHRFFSPIFESVVISLFDCSIHAHCRRRQVFCSLFTIERSTIEISSFIRIHIKQKPINQPTITIIIII